MMMMSVARELCMAGGECRDVGSSQGRWKDVSRDFGVARVAA